MSNAETFDVVVVGGGPSGSTAATDLAQHGHDVLLLDRAGRIKPCGGAIPPALIAEFEIPDHLLVARISSARMVSPSDRQVDMPIDGGCVNAPHNRERSDAPARFARSHATRMAWPCCTMMCAMPPERSPPHRCAPAP